MKAIKWLDEFAKAQQAKTQAASKKMTKTASKKMQKVASIDEANYIILDRSKLPNAKDGLTVKYHGAKWRVVKASYKDAKGTGVALKRVAEISNKPVTAPAEMARQDPGNVYDYNVRETSEVPDFQAAAQATEQAIAADAQKDMTTPAGRYSNPSAVQQQVAPEAFAGVAPEEVSVLPEEVPEEVPAEAPVDDLESFDDVDADLDVAEDAPTEDVPAEDVPAEDVPVEDVPVEDVPAEDVSADDLESFDDVDTDLDVAEDAPAEESTDLDTVEDAPVEEDADVDVDVDADAPADVDLDTEEETPVEAKAKSKVRKTVAKPQSIYHTNPILARIVSR